MATAMASARAEWRIGPRGNCIRYLLIGERGDGLECKGSGPWRKIPARVCRPGTGEAGSGGVGRTRRGPGLGRVAALPPVPGPDVPFQGEDAPRAPRYGSGRARHAAGRGRNRAPQRGDQPARPSLLIRRLRPRSRIRHTMPCSGGCRRWKRPILRSWPPTRRRSGLVRTQGDAAERGSRRPHAVAGLGP